MSHRDQRRPMAVPRTGDFELSLFRPHSVRLRRIC
jgi:hypothetical protein